MGRRGIELQRDHGKRRLAPWQERPEVAHARRHLGQGQRPQAGGRPLKIRQGRLPSHRRDLILATRQGALFALEILEQDHAPGVADRLRQRGIVRRVARSGRGAGRTRSPQHRASTRRSISSRIDPARPLAQPGGEAQTLAGAPSRLTTDHIRGRLERAAGPEQPAEPEALLQGHAPRAKHDQQADQDGGHSGHAGADQRSHGHSAPTDHPVIQVARSPRAKRTSTAG